MIDIHCHILPRIDDGAKSEEEALKMAKIAESEGIHYIIATPHYIQHSNFLNREQLEAEVETFNHLLQKEDVQLRVALGHEVYLTPDLPEMVQRKEVATLNNSSYLLLEFPMNDIPLYTEDILYELKLQGITPIIAHPERYPQVIENPNVLLKFLAIGALCQLNVGSVVGLFGEDVKRTADILIKHNMVHFVGTDAHSSRRRAPHMQKGIVEVTRLDASKVKELFYDNSFKVYSNLPLEPKMPIEYVKPTLLHKIKKMLKVS